MNRDVATSHRVLPLAIAMAALAVAPVFGQRPVLTVGGQNPQFTDLPAAVAAALPGSVLHVRAGTYTGFVTNKPLRILLDFTATPRNFSESRKRSGLNEITRGNGAFFYARVKGASRAVRVCQPG